MNGDMSNKNKLMSDLGSIASSGKGQAMLSAKLGSHRAGLVAQLAERRLCEAEALGSNPSESIWTF